MFSLRGPTRSLCKCLILSFLLTITRNVSNTAQAQLTIQSNPTLSSPTLPEQNLGSPPKPFPGEVVEFDPSVTEPSQSDSKSKASDEIRVGDITLAGNHYYNTWTIQRQLRPLLEKKGNVLKVDDLKKELNQINKFNKFKLKATIIRQEMDAEKDIRLDVYEQQPWQIVTTFDNQGRPGIGFYRLGAQIVNKSLLGFGDEMSVQYVGSNRTHRLATEYRFPLNTRGGEFNFQYAYQTLDYDPALTPSTVRDLTGRDSVWGATLSQPIDKNRVWTPYISMFGRQVIIKRNGEEVVNGSPRSLTLGLRYNTSDRFGKTNIDISPLIVSQRWFGGDSKCYRAKANLYRSINLPKGNQLVFRGAWQVTPDGLPTAQQFQIGGEYTVRGYTEGLITADRGHFYSLEHFWPVPFIGKLYPGLDGRLRGVTFVDFGQSWLDKSSPRYVNGVSYQRDRTTLMAIGLGLRVRMTQYVQGFIDAGWGVFNRNNIELLSQPTMRVHFGIRSNLLPQPFATRPDKQTTL
jgi:hemolysin activation/secretion protein